MASARPVPRDACGAMGAFRSPLFEESDLMRNPFQLPTSLVCCIATAMRRFIAGGVGRLFWAVRNPRKVQNAVRAATAPRGLPHAPPPALFTKFGCHSEEDRDLCGLPRDLCIFILHTDRNSKKKQNT
jgi:hypothetical protein